MGFEPGTHLTLKESSEVACLPDFLDQRPTKPIDQIKKLKKKNKIKNQQKRMGFEPGTHLTLKESSVACLPDFRDQRPRKPINKIKRDKKIKTKKSKETDGIRTRDPFDLKGVIVGGMFTRFS